MVSHRQRSESVTSVSRTSVAFSWEDIVNIDYFGLAITSINILWALSQASGWYITVIRSSVQMKCTLPT